MLEPAAWQSLSAVGGRERCTVKIVNDKKKSSDSSISFIYPWKAVVAPEVSFPDCPFSVLFGQDGLLTFPLANRIEQHEARGQEAYLCIEQPYPL